MPQPLHASPAWFGSALTLLVLVAGVFYVKWDPYFHKALVVHASHSLGSSILRVGSPSRVSFAAAWSYAFTYGKDIWTALIVGIVAGGAVQTMLPKRLVFNWLGKAGIHAHLRAGMLAVPSMMCTCCSAPLVVSMRRQHASLPASLTYWLGNPLLNPATIVFAAFVLSWQWALLRLGAGLALVAVVALMSRRWAGETATHQFDISDVESPVGTIAGMLGSWAKSSGRLALWVFPEWAVIALGLGAVRTWLFPLGAHPLAFGLLALIGLALAGTIFVIPTAGEIPIVQALLSTGSAPGLAGALLIALPAISLPSMVMTRLAFPTRILIFTAGVVAIMAVFTGLFTQWLF